MTTLVRWTRPAIDDLRRLDRQVSRRVHAAMRRYADAGQGSVLRLEGSDEWRLRVGDWRVRFRVQMERQDDQPVRVIEVLRVLPRERAYRD